jgi:hypothetical protein
MVACLTAGLAFYCPTCGFFLTEGFFSGMAFSKKYDKARRLSKHRMALHQREIRKHLLPGSAAHRSVFLWCFIQKKGAASGIHLSEVF